MHKENKKKKIIITGVAGFVGFHLAELLLGKGYAVYGIDNLSDYYDPKIKRKRLAILRQSEHFTFKKLDLGKYKELFRTLSSVQADELIHLAAQAGVRYSLTNPWAYADANYLGTLNVFEAAKELQLPRVIYASSSSVYGDHDPTPFREEDRTDTPLSIYAASKKANEVLAHSYAHLYDMEMIGLRFFTVYGRWGRPDMALFKFARAALVGEPIDLYNEGKMKRSFTHVSDTVGAIEKMTRKKVCPRHSLYNIGGAESVPLLDFVAHIEHALGVKVEKYLLPLQPGDVPETVADCSKVTADYGYKSKVTIEKGIADFATWFQENKKFLLSLEIGKQ